MAKTKLTGKREFFPAFLITIGCVMLLLWGTHKFFYNRALTLSDSVLAGYAKEDTQSALPIHIAIGERISLPVVEAGKMDGVWAVSRTSANHVRGSALPGQKGNIIIYGHNTNKIFGYLLDIKVGGVIKIRMTDGVLHTYTVSSTHYVSPTETALLAATNQETLTIYTCAGLFDSLRFIVRAAPTSSK